MATRPVYSATIKFNFDTKGLEKSVKNIESIVRGSIQDIGKMTSDIKLDIPSLEKIGPLGGLSDIGVKLARQIRADVKGAFEGLGDEIKPGDVERALEGIADTFGTTSKSILAVMDRLKGVVGDSFRELKESGIEESQALYDALIGHSIFRKLFDETVAGFRQMSKKSSDIFESMVDHIISAASDIEGVDLSEKLASQIGDKGPVMDAGPVSDAMRKVGTVVQETRNDVYRAMVDIDQSISSAIPPSVTLFNSMIDALRSLGSTAVKLGRSDWSDLKDAIASLGPTVSKVKDGITSANKAISAATPPAKELILTIGANASSQINKTTQSIDNFGKGFRDAFKDQVSPTEALDAPGFRESIAEIKQTLDRLPDKTSATFNLLKRSFGEVTTEAIRVQKQFEKGIAKEKDLIAAKKRLDGIGESISKLKVSELERLRIELQRNADTVDVTSRSFSDRMQNIRDGISLASETGENKLLSLRLALSGTGEATGVVSKLLDRFTSSLDDVGKAEGRLSEITSRTTKSLASQNNAIKSSIDAIKQVAKIEGLHAGALNEVDAQVSRVEKSYKDMTTTIEATGKATPQQVARVREEYRLLQESISLVKKENKDAIGPETLVALGDLEKKISRNVPATRLLAATLDAASAKVEKLKSSSKELSGSVQKNIGLFGRIKQSLKDFFGFASKSSDEMDALGESTSKAASIAATAGGVFIGAFGATLLSSIGGIKGALISLTDSVSSQVQRSTERIQKAFSLLPSEAEAVSGVISDVYVSNLGGSIDEIGEATQRAIARFKELGVTSQDEISGVVKDAFRLSDIYKFDVPESLDAAAVLMKSFNLTTKESTEFLTGLGQAGIIGSDAIDSILEYATQIQSAGGNADDLFNIIRTGFAGGGTLGTDKAVDLFKEFRLLISEGSDDVKDALNEIGINSTQLMAQLSDGTISVTDAFDFVNEKLGQLDSQTDITRLGATIMGTQFEDMGNQMALAIRTTGTSMADLSGITVGLATTYTDLGTGMEAINRKLQVSLGPLKDTFLALANQAIPFVMSGIDALAPVVERVAARVQLLIDALSGGDWGMARDIVIEAIASMAESVASTLDWMIAAGFDWGANFVIEIANGLIETANSVIVDAVNYISDIIQSFWAPGSPPEKGPLSDIDKWGKGLVETFGESFSSADFKFVEQATKPIEEHFKKTFGKGGFEAFEGVRDKFTEIVSEINKTGIIDETKFGEIETAIGGANTELTKMLKIQLKMKSAEQALANIQEEATAAQAAGFVSEGLKKKLKAAEEEVTTAKENVEWQKEFLKFQGLSEDKFGAMGGAAAKGAAGATKAIKGAVDRQLLFINEGFEKEKRLLQEKFDAGIIGEDEHLKKLIKLEEKYVGLSQEKGLLSGAQLSKWGERLSHLKGSLKELQTAARAAKKNIVPIGEAIFGAEDTDVDVEGITGGIGKNLLTGAKELGSSFSDNLADGLLETAKTRLTAAFSDIGTNVSTLFQEKILVKITPAQKETGGIIGAALLGIGVSTMITKIGLVASKIGMLSGAALRLSVIGTGIWLVWKNWDAILAGVSAAVEYLDEVWVNFSERLGGTEEVLATFSGIFTDIKDVLSEIGTSLVDFVLDALEGESISFADFIGIFDFSAIETGPITGVIEAIGDTFRDEAGKVKLSIFGPDGLIKVGDSGGETTRIQRIFANFISIFERTRARVQAVQEAFSAFMAEDRLGGRIAGLINAISVSWRGLSLALIPILVKLPVVAAILTKITPFIGSVVSALGKLIPIVGIATVFIGNFEKIWPPLEIALSGAVLAVTGIVEAIGGIFLLFDDETRAEGAQMFFGGLVDTISGLQELFLGLGITIANFFISAAADVSGGIATLLESFGLVSDPFRDLETALDSLPEKLNTMLDDAVAILRSLKIQMKVILFLAARNFTNWVKGIWESVTGWFTKLYNDLVGNSIITDMIADIIKALGMEEAVKKVQLVVTTIKLAFFSAKRYVSTQMSLLAIAINSKFSAMSTFVSGKITTLKGFVTDVTTFISDTVTAVGELKLPTLDDIATSVSGVVDSITELTGIDIGAGLATVGESLSGITIESMLPTEEEVKTGMSTFTTSVATSIANLGVTINSSIEGAKTTIGGLFTGLDKTVDATAFAIGVATPISLMETTIGESATGIVTSLAEMFDIDLSVSITEMSTVVTTGIETMAKDGITAVSGFATDFVDYILGIPGRIKEKISSFTDVGSLLKNAFGFGGEDITGEVASELKSGEAGIVAPVESTTDKIKDAWTDAYDFVVGNSVVPDLVTGVTEQFTLLSTAVQPTVTSMTLGIQNSFIAMSSVVTGSVMAMNLAIYTNTHNTNLLISNDYLLLSQNVSMHMLNMQTNTSMTLGAVRPMWQSSFTAMISITELFGTVGKQVLTAIDNAVKKLTISVGKLRLGLINAKVALDELRETDLVDLTDSFEYMLALVKKTKSEAEKFAKFMEAAAKSAESIGDTLGGNTAGDVPGAQHGAWNVPRNQLMFIHKRETILPEAVASNFRRLMMTLQEAGIGGRSFGFQTGTPQAVAGKATGGGPTIVNIYPNFPNVTSAQEASGIETELNKLIDDARKYTSVGGQS